MVYRYAQLDPANICMAVSELSGEVDAPHMVLLADELTEDVIGHRYENGQWVEVPQEPVAEPVADISSRQFFQGLYKRELITKQEALAAISTGAIPAVMQSLIDQLPEETRDDAEFLIAGATMFERLNPVAEFIRMLFGWSAEQADDFWRFAATL